MSTQSSWRGRVQCSSSDALYCRMTRTPSSESPAAFYNNYDPMEGVVTAVVLGGFFTFVCLLVLYKTKCKPVMRQRWLKGNGVSQPPVAYVENDIEVAEKPDNECIPLNELESNEIVVDDLCYASSVLTVLEPGSAERLAARRPHSPLVFLDEFDNLIVATSKPLCPACCQDNFSRHGSQRRRLQPPNRRQSQMSSVSNAFTIKSLPGALLYIPLLDPVLVSNVTDDENEELDDVRVDGNNFASPIRRTLSETCINDEPRNLLKTAFRTRTRGFGARPRASTCTAYQQHRSYSIQPDSSLLLGGHVRRQPDVECVAIQVTQATPNLSPSGSMRSFSNDESNALIVNVDTPTLVVPETRRRSTGSKVDRRVSFSEDSNDDSSEQVLTIGSPIRRQPMQYLQVPGQVPTTCTFVVPSVMSQEALAAQTSVQARQRRATRLMKAGSFASLNSDEELVFPNHHNNANNENNNDEDNVNIDENELRGRKGSYADPLSEYSEFVHDDCRSDISELFQQHASTQSTLSSQDSLEQEMSESGSCSISMGESEGNESSNMITVPVTIEHPPPELRVQELAEQAAEGAAAQLGRQDTLHTDSGMEMMDEIAAASSPKPETDAPLDEDDENTVLVRDVGTQVTADSPMLNNLPRIFPTNRILLRKSASAAESEQRTSRDKRHKFSTEILF